MTGDDSAGHSKSSPKSARSGSGIITSRNSIATSIEVSDTRVSRNATSEWVYASKARVRCSQLMMPGST